MRREDAGGASRAVCRGAEFAHIATGGGVADLTRRRLEVLPVELVKRSVLDAERQPEALAELAHKSLVPVGRRPAQMMVDVQDMQALARDARPAAAVGDIERARARHNEKRR